MRGGGKVPVGRCVQANLLTSYFLLIWGGWSETSCMHETRNDVLFCLQLNCSVCTTKRQSNSILFSGSPGFQDTRLLLPLLPLCSHQTFRALKHNKHDLSMPKNNINLRTVSYNPFNKF